MFNRDAVRVTIIAVGLAMAGFVVAYQFVEPSPPKTLTIATGSKSGAYYAFAGRYLEILARDGIDLKVLETGGSLDNIQLLEDGKADVAFVQGGVGDSTANPTFESMGSLYFEPLWVFAQTGASISILSDLHGKRISAGGMGSGTWAVTKQLLELNGVATEGEHVAHLSNADAVRALDDGAIDAAFFVASPSAPLINDLLASPKFKLLNFERAEAYTSQQRQLSAVHLYQGVISLSRNIPPHDVTLLAPAATLTATDNLHPALVSLLVRAAKEVHGSGGLFEAPGQFPSSLYTDFPMNEDAKRFIESGPPFLQRFLPFWAAVMFDRLAVMLVPLITLLIPLSKILPPAYRWRVRSRIFKWYADLGAIERRAHDGADIADLIGELDAIAHDVREMKVPLSYTDEVYNLRLHIDLIRRELQTL